MTQKGRGCGLSKAKKDAYYDLKNNEKIDWRSVLSVLVRQFMRLSHAGSHDDHTGTCALIADDTTVCKSGLKIELTSRVHDHTSGSFVFGYKVLVLAGTMANRLSPSISQSIAKKAQAAKRH